MNGPPDRASRLDDALLERGLDLLLVSDLVNVRYLTGFAGTSALCLTGPDRRVFLTDFRYIERAQSEVTGWEVQRSGRDMLQKVCEAVVDLVVSRPVRLGFDDANLTVKQHGRLKELAGENIELVGASGLVEDLREIKDEGEIGLIRRAARVADSLYEWLVEEHGLVGRTERDVASAIEVRALELGARVSFPPIVAAGPNGALPHAEPGDSTISTGSLVVVDMGCEVEGYCSDCTRTFATGSPSPQAREVYELVQAAQAAALRKVAAGVQATAVDSAARDLIEQAGRGEQFGHGTGHGVGLEVHEGPRIAPGCEGRLAAGNVITIEPGVYVPGNFGVRIEDLVVVAADGVEVLTNAPKDLMAP